MATEWNRINIEFNSIDLEELRNIYIYFEYSYTHILNFHIRALFENEISRNPLLLSFIITIKLLQYYLSIIIIKLKLGTKSLIKSDFTISFLATLFPLYKWNDETFLPDIHPRLPSRSALFIRLLPLQPLFIHLYRYKVKRFQHRMQMNGEVSAEEKFLKFGPSHDKGVCTSKFRRTVQVSVENTFPRWTLASSHPVHS